MDAVEDQPWQAEVFCKCNLLYLYCVDLSYNFSFTIPSLPFLKLNGLFGHASFPGSQAERRMVVLPRGDKVLAKLKDVVSPCVIEVKSSVSFKIHPEEVEEGFTEQDILIIWDFSVNPSMFVLSSSSLVRPRMPSATKNMPYMPLLDLNCVSCNCSDFPRTGGVLQNRNTTEGTSCAAEMERLSILEGHSNSGEEDEDEDSEAEVSELEEEEIVENPCASPPNSTVHFVPSQTLFPNDDIQEFTETFTLKGSSFHEHFQNTIQQCKEALKAKELIPVKFVFEPINRRDENASVVKVKFGSWEPIGYIPGRKKSENNGGNCGRNNYKGYCKER